MDLMGPLRSEPGDSQQCAQACGQLGVQFLESRDAASFPQLEQLVGDVRTHRGDRHQTFPVERVKVERVTGDRTGRLLISAHPVWTPSEMATKSASSCSASAAASFVRTMQPRAVRASAMDVYLVGSLAEAVPSDALVAQLRSTSLFRVNPDTESACGSRLASRRKTLFSGRPTTEKRDFGLRTSRPSRRYCRESRSEDAEEEFMSRQMRFPARANAKLSPDMRWTTSVTNETTTP